MEILQDLQEKMLMTLASKCDKTKEAMFYVAANIEFDRDTAYNWIFNKLYVIIRNMLYSLRNVPN